MREPREIPKSPYDPVETPEQDLWFLPGPPEDVAQTDPPWPLADRRGLVEVQAWIAAERDLAVELARTASAFAALDERMRHLPDGVRRRLAIREASNLSWAEGTRLSSDRIALYDLMRESSASDDVAALQQANWVIRRLLAGQGALDWPDRGIEGFLDRVVVRNSQEDFFLSRPTGQELWGLFDDWACVQTSAAACHAITKAALGFHVWRAYGLSKPGELFEAAVVAAKIGAEEGRGGMSFLPISGGSAGVFLAGGTAKERLQRWYREVEHSSLAALLELDRLQEWRTRVAAAVRDLSGKTPPRLIEALAVYPALSAEMAAKTCGVSKASALRNLVEFGNRGLVREITGQERYRFWAVATNV